MDMRSVTRLQSIEEKDTTGCSIPVKWLWAIIGAMAAILGYVLVLTNSH